MAATAATDWGRLLSGARTVYDAAALYEAVYLGRGKDYAAEAAAVAELAREHRAKARDLLDVGCGTAAHLAHLAPWFERVEGVDMAASMVGAARRRLPGVPVHQADMRGFDLGRRFDVVTSLFSAVGNVADAAELVAALRCMRRHLRPGGVLLVEPWWFPENFRSGHVGRDVVEADGVTVARVSHSVRRGAHSHMAVHYVVAEPGRGVWHFSDDHVMALIPRDGYLAAFREAGMDAELRDLANGGPGIFVARACA